MKYFGTDGFRGKANENLTVDHAIKIGKFLGWYFGVRQGRTAKCIIGKDTRRSSYMYEYGLSAGLTSTGADVSLLHVTTTPGVSFITRTENFDFGIMITASHNPFYDNGIKIINQYGYKMEEEVLSQIEDFIDDEIDIPLAKLENIGKCYDYIQGRNKYISYLTSIPVRSMRGRKIGLDCANGAASSIAKTVFDMLGAKTYVINNEPSGININVDCGSTHMTPLQELVKNEQLDVGFAFDGDADRCIAVDENGNIVNGDLILYVCGCHLKEENKLEKNTVVTTVMSNLGLYKALERKGIQFIQTPVGDKYVSAAIKEEGFSIGGEQSGHIIFNKYSIAGDGILTALQIMEVIVEKQTMLSYLVSDVTIYPQKLENVKVDDMNVVLADNGLKELVAKIELEMDGEGRILLRKSGTEPLIRVMVECKTYELCNDYIDQITAYIKSFK